MNRIVRGFTQNSAQTDPDAGDKRLRGRTYAIPFDDVWGAAMALADGGIRGWTLISSDDQRGSIVAESRTLVFKFVDDVRVHVGLDENAQTRVDLRSASRKGSGDLGRNPRTIGAFLKKLDKRLKAAPEQILDPTKPVSWSS